MFLERLICPHPLKDRVPATFGKEEQCYDCGKVFKAPKPKVPDTF